MNAAPPHLAPARRPAQPAQPAVPSTSMRWAALAEAAQVVAMLAGLETERPSKEVRNFPALIRDCDRWRRALADNAIADLSAIMEPGLATLLAINARGADCRPAALALWREFVEARSAVLALLPPTGALGPRRSA